MTLGDGCPLSSLQHLTPPVTPQQIFNLVKDELQQVEREFARQSESSVRTISDIGKYLQEGGGKRIRPCLLLLCTRLCGRADEAAIKLAAVVEFIHAATLVHDDIIDGAETRRGRLAVNRKWGNQVTVLAGDWLYMQSFAVALQQRNFQILDILIDLTQRMVEGELIQLTFNGNRRVTEAEVLDIARRETAYLWLRADWRRFGKRQFRTASSPCAVRVVGRSGFRSGEC